MVWSGFYPSLAAIPLADRLGSGERKGVGRRNATFCGLVSIALIVCSALLTPDKVKDAQPWEVHLLRLVGIAFGVGMGSFSWKTWVSADHADQGAAAEEAIAADLRVLEQKGWKFQYGMLMNGIGDLDVVATSPTGKGFVIDVKSHSGTVIVHKEKLVPKVVSLERVRLS